MLRPSLASLIEHQFAHNITNPQITHQALPAAAVCCFAARFAWLPLYGGFMQQYRRWDLQRLHVANDRGRCRCI